VKSRRHLLVEALEHLPGGLGEFHRSRLSAIRSKEDELDDHAHAQKEQETIQPSLVKNFVVRLQTSFSQLMDACGEQVVGCYSPEGDHAEKVIEIALKANAGLISLYEEIDGQENPKELENIEVYF